MLQDRPVKVGTAMVEVTEEDLFGGDVAELPKLMHDLVSRVEEEVKDFDDVGMVETGTKMVKEVNEVS